MKKVKRYIQEKNSIEKVQQYIPYQKTLIIIGSFKADIFKEKIVQSFTNEYECIVYDKECTEANILHLVDKMKNEHFDSVVGFGGGKILDIAKAITYYYPCYLVVIPSSASMDGACSALSVLYNEDNSFNCFLYLPKNPDVVIVDTQIIFDAPFSLLCAGMSDAISSYYDYMYACSQNKKVESEVIESALRCKDVIYQNYEQVKKDFQDNILSEAIEEVVYTNIYDSAVAFENIDCEFSHILANATTKVKGSKGMHGERVGVSTLFQLLLEKNYEDYDCLKHVLMTLQMPTTLKELNVNDPMQLLDSIMNECKQLQIAFSKSEIKDVLMKVRG